MASEDRSDTPAGAEPPPARAAGDLPEEGEEARPFGLLPVLVLLVLVAGGIFLVFELRDISQAQDCAWSGRKNCAPVEGAGR